MVGKTNRSLTWLISLVLFGLVAAVFLPVIACDFTNYDDPDYVTENRPVLGGLTLHGLTWAFTHYHSANWHPLTWISHMLDCQFFGLNPAGHHLTSLLLHAANAVILFLFLRSLTETLWPGAFLAAIFALHPLRVESVAWISERKDVLSAFFGLLCLWAYTAYAKTTAVESTTANATERSSARRTRFYHSLAVSAFALGLMSKPMLVTWPFVMLLLDFWPLRRLVIQKQSIRRLLVEKIPFFILSAASCTATVLVQKSAGALASAPFLDRLMNAIVCYALYVCKTFWPFSRLAVLYPEVAHWSASEVVLATLFLAAVSRLTLWQIKRRPWLFMGWAWFLGTLVPVIGLVKVGSQSMADRYTYLPSIGLLVMVTWTVTEFISGLPSLRVFACGAITVVLAACATATGYQLQVWQNTGSLFRHAIAVTRDNYVAYSSLAFYYAEYHEFRQAEDCLHVSLRINPNYYQAWTKLGSVLIDKHQFSDAEAACRTAVQLDSSFAPAHSTLGLALMKIGQTNEAIAEYKEALRLRPDFSSAHYNLANALAAQGQFDQAQFHYRAALQSDSGSVAAADAHNNLAYLLFRSGNLDEAVVHFGAAMAKQPRFWQAHYGLGDVLLRQGKLEQAAQEFYAVTRLKPDQPSAHYQLAVVLERSGKPQEAIPQYQSTLQLNSSHVEALNRLAWILSTNPDPQWRDGAKALELAEHACKLTNFQRPTLLLTLAAAYAEAGKFTEAVNAAERAHGALQAAGQNDLVLKSQILLDEFRSGKPHREAPASR